MRQPSDEVLEIVRAGATEALVVQHAPRDTRPYLHPLRAPDGRGVLTAIGKPGRGWQYGVFIGLNQVGDTGQRFWKDIRAFHPRPLAKAAVDGATVRWRVETAIGDAAAPMLIEEQAWTCTDRGDRYELDLVWTLTAQADLRFGKFAYGGLFVRMPWAGVGEGVDSDGRVGTAAEQQRARWLALAMPVAGRDGPAGIAILDHPGNPVHPTPWRFDGSWGVGPSRSGLADWSLARGERSTSRYRLHVFTGGIDARGIEDAWKRYATAPEAPHAR